MNPPAVFVLLDARGKTPAVAVRKNPRSCRVVLQGGIDSTDGWLSLDHLLQEMLEIRRHPG